MEKIEQTFKKTLKSFPEIKVSIQYEDKLTGISIIKEDHKKYTIYIGVLGKKFLEQTNEEELTGIIAHELSHGVAEEEGTAKPCYYLSEQERLEDDMVADEKAAEKGYKEQMLAALKLTKKIYTDWTGSLEARIKNLGG